MAKKTAPLLPSTDALLRQFSDRLRLVRLRRRLPAKHVAEVAGMSPMTLRSLERGGSGVTIGAYLSVMQVLGIEEDLNLLAQSDPVGHQLQDARLPSRRSPARLKGETAPRRRGTDLAGDGVAQLQRLINKMPEEQLRRWIESLGQTRATAVQPDTAARDRSVEATQPDAVAAMATRSPQARFDWLDAPASDLKKLVKPAREVRDKVEKAAGAAVKTASSKRQ
ncbi:MAG: helix-turn-helix domain-containing protein [Porticoccaceae bacterium]